MLRNLTLGTLLQEWLGSIYLPVRCGDVLGEALTEFGLARPLSYHGSIIIRKGQNYTPHMKLLRLQRWKARIPNQLELFRKVNDLLVANLLASGGVFCSRTACKAHHSLTKLLHGGLYFGGFIGTLLTLKPRSCSFFSWSSCLGALHCKT